MSLSVEVFDHHKGGVYYVLLQHDTLYEMDELNPQGVLRCTKLGSVWPKGEMLTLDSHKFGRLLQMSEVPPGIRKEVMNLISKEITHV